MTGMPVAMCPPNDWHNNDPVPAQYRTGVRMEGYKPSPFLKKIDDLIELIASLPSKIMNPPKVQRHILLSDRMNMAQNLKITREEMELLLVDRNPLVRIELAWNESVPEALLIQLVKDRNSAVSKIAKLRLSTMLNLAV